MLPPVFILYFSALMTFYSNNFAIIMCIYRPVSCILMLLLLFATCVLLLNIFIAQLSSRYQAIQTDAMKELERTRARIVARIELKEEVMIFYTGEVRKYCKMRSVSIQQFYMSVWLCYDAGVWRPSVCLLLSFLFLNNSKTPPKLFVRSCWKLIYNKTMKWTKTYLFELTVPEIITRSFPITPYRVFQPIQQKPCKQ